MRNQGLHYGNVALRRSLTHFIMGRGITAVASLAILILLVRELEMHEFAVYMSWHATMLMTGMLSSFGVNPLLLRYIPDLRANDENRAMYAMLIAGIVARLTLFALSAGLLLTFSGTLAELLKFEEYLWLFPLYVVVGFILVNSTFAVAVLESLLWQREAQYSIAISTLIRLFGLLYLVETGNLSLFSYVWLELVTELAGWLLLMLCATWRWLRDPMRDLGTPGILRTNLSRYVSFAGWAYLQNLTAVLNGSPANRLFIGFFLPVNSIAVFGVVDRFIRFLRRYEPLLMFVGLVRPIFNSRYRGPGDFDRLVALAELLFRVNLLVLVTPMILLAVAGDILFDWITKGNYPDVAPVFLGFYVVIIIGSINTVLDIIVKMVEHPRVYTLANLALSTSIILAIPMVSTFGLWSLVIANGTGYLLSVAVIAIYLHRYGFTLRVDPRCSSRIVGATAAAILLGLLMRHAGVNLTVSVAGSYFCFLGMLAWLPPFSPEERMRMQRFWALRKVAAEPLTQPGPSA